MAAEDSGTSPAPASNPILPHYPELILAAIEAIDNKNGANKSKISKQIEASYGGLPAAHKTLLSHNLNKMKASGELVIIKNNYVKPDPNTPLRRGRGRPAKPREPLPEGTVISPPRPRGRPAKPREPLPEGTVISPPRPRGRPPKSHDASSTVSSLKEATPSVTGRKRGRPPKLGKETAAASTPQPSTGGKRGRGRPRKVKTGDSTLSAPPPPTGERRGRGRPPKVKTVGPVGA